MPPPTPSQAAPSSQQARTKQGVLLEDLKFNVVGLRGLRGYLGDGAVYQKFQARFDAADIAWFIAGAHKDGTHFLPPDRFHDMWKHARVVESNGTDAMYRERREFRDRLRDLVWDAVTVLDRISGGASILVHSPGTVEPGQRRELPFLKLDVYAPPFIFYENPIVDRPLASIVQTFAAEVALPATHRWHCAFEALGFGLKKEVPVVEPPSNLPFMPEPQRCTTLYRCRGRRVGELEAMLAQAADHAGPTDRDGPGCRDGHGGRSGPAANHGEDDVDSLRAQIAHLEALIREKDEEIVALGVLVDDGEREILRLEGVVEARDCDILRLEEEVEALKRVTPPPVLVPQPIRALPAPAPTPTPSRNAYSPPPLAPRPSSQTAAATPARAAPTTPISSRMSSISLSSWSSAAPSLPPSPSPSQLRSPAKMEWVMPMEIVRQSSAPVTATSMGGLATSSSAVRAPTTTRTPTLRRFDIVGPRTQAVLAAHDLPTALHRSLRDLVYGHPQSLWYSILTEQMSLSQEVAMEVIQALEEDVPPE